MLNSKATPVRGQSSGARVVPLNIETAKQLGGGARGRTLALIYRQLCYWSKYAKWRGSRNRKFFYKAQRELAEELGYSEKTISRAIKALRELGLIVVEKLHKRYWKQTYFYYLPHSPFASADAPQAQAEPPVRSSGADAAGSSSTTINPSSRDAVSALGAAQATAQEKHEQQHDGRTYTAVDPQLVYDNFTELSKASIWIDQEGARWYKGCREGKID